MGALTGMIGNAIDAYSGSGSSRPKLQDFLDKFSSSQGRYVDTIDPLGLFKVRFRFFPSLTADELMQRGGSALGRVGQSLVNSLKTMGTSVLDNATGGLFSSLTEGGAGSVMNAKEKFSETGRHSFMEYLAEANLLQGGEQWDSAGQANCPLTLDLSPYVQKITAPNIQMGGEQKSTINYLGEFPINGTYVQANGELQMEVINTKASLCERLFYPWMRECVMPFWSYDSQPYTTAEITVDFTSHNDCRYVFCGCRPKQIKMLDATQEADSGNLERNVVFMYDFMFVTSDLNVNDSWSDKLLGAAGALAGGAAGMVNM